MKRKRLRIASVVVLLAVIAAIPASTQVLMKSAGAGEEADHLPLLILVNRMELTTEQMEEIHGLLVGLVEEREALEIRRAELEEAMIAFNGTAEELDAVLEAFRAETEPQLEAAREHALETIDRIKEILSAKQGELLDSIFPGFLGGRDVGVRGRLGQPGEGSAFSLREQIAERLRGRFENQSEMAEGFRQRFGDSSQTQQSPDAHGMRGSMMMGRRMGGQSQFGGGFQHVGMKQRGLDWIEQLIEVLELKLGVSD